MSVPRVVALGVDAADANLVRRWAGEGHLPTFATLLETSLVAPIATPVGVLEGGIWPTLLSSSSPATHGMFAFQSLKAGATLVQLYSGLIYRGPTLIGECVEAMRRRKEAPSRGNVPPDH